MPETVELSPEDFGAFYRELYPKRIPYRWHERVAVQLANEEAWQNGAIWDTLSAPTGTGKTTLIECFLFALACTRGGTAVPRRLFWVVDRRSVVDQVYRHACEVVDRIAAAPAEGLIGTVHARLEELAAQTTLGEAVQVRLWRGGFVGEAAIDPQADHQGDPASEEPRDETNIEVQLRSERLRAPLSPCAAAIVCSTVDQIGSRMLFRGYGVSRRSQPVEAALIGTGSLIVLDEAHLSGPFQITATAVAQQQSAREEIASIRGVKVLPITATLPRDDSDGNTPSKWPFEMTDDERADPALQQVLAVSRPTILEKGRDTVRACREAAHRCADEGAHVIGVVANTVANARKIATSLRAYGDMILIIGPSRPLDRARLLDLIPDRDSRVQLERPLFVVGTQTLEVGLDIDFDAMVTECAPLSSLVQRLGRLDRAGRLTAEGKPGPAVIVQPPSGVCPVYGEATTEAWNYLATQEELEPLNFETKRVTEMLATAPSRACQAPQPKPPLLKQWHTELLIQTSHPLIPEPDVAVFLHGNSGLDTADVSVCWRADLTGDPSDTWEHRVALRPPHAGELVSLPIWSVRRWLSNTSGTEDFGDVEGVDDPDSEHAQLRFTSQVIQVLPPGYDGGIKPKLIEAKEIQTGDVIVLPASRGGCDEFGWNPSSSLSVTDFGNLSQSRPRILLSAALGLSDDATNQLTELCLLLASEEISQEEAYEQALPVTREWLAAGAGYGAAPAGDAARRLAQRLEQAPTGKAIPIEEGDRSTSADLLLLPDPPRRDDATAAAVLYETHARKVEERVRKFADSLRLNEEIALTLATAARHHDIGKLDPRFQAWLNGGSPLDPQRAPLAKSARGLGITQSRTAREDAKWPPGKRHEITSAALLNRVPMWDKGVDRNLLLYLGPTHHGDGRPMHHYAPDPEPVEVTANIGGHDITVLSDEVIPWPEHAGRFRALNERFGPWGLAMIESLLVLADRAVSAEGS